MKKILSLLLCLGTIFSMMVGLCLPVSAENIVNTDFTPYDVAGTTKQTFTYNNASYRITYNGSLASASENPFMVGFCIDNLGDLSIKLSYDGVSAETYPLYRDQIYTQAKASDFSTTSVDFYSDFDMLPEYPSVSIEYVIPKYAIAATVDPSDTGTVTGAGTYDEGSSVTLKASPNTGYEFSGWYENSILVSNSNPYEFKADTNHSFTARFAVQQLHITTDDTVVGGTYSVVPSIINYGKDVTLTAVPDPGYSFTAWEYSADGGKSYKEFGNANTKQTTFRGVTSDLIIRPVFTGKPFKVTFDANNGSGTQMATQDFTYNSGALLQKCTYTRTGYSFIGWNTKADRSGTPLKDEANGSLLSDEGTNVTLYAQWTLTKYTITYNLDGGEMSQGEKNPTEYTVETPDFTFNDPVRENYKFLGWAGPGITKYITPFVFDTGRLENVTYTAKWEAETYTIEFKPGSHGSINGSGGSPLTSYSLSSKYDTDFPVFNTGTSLDGRTLTAEAGYTFAGWRDEDGNAPGAKVTGNASYTAQWTENTDTAYTVQFLSRNYTGSVLSYDVIRAEASKTGITDAVVDISALVNEFPIPGYHYINEADYYIHSNSTTQKPVGQNGVQIVGDGSLVIRLYYTENSFVKLTLAVNNANRGSIQRYSDGFYLPPATGRSKDISVNVVSGCTFEKWVYTDAAHSTPTDVPNAISPTLTAAQIDSVAKDTGIYEPVTFTAIITEPTATYNYSVASAGGGTVTKDTETIDAVTGEAAGSTAVPATGYDFEKWTYKIDGTTASTSAAFAPGKVNGAYAGANYEAVFKKQTFAVNASVAPLETGTVTGTGTFEYGTGTTLTATPAAGYHFGGWSLNGSSAGTDAILTISNIKEIRNYTAQFEGNNYTVKFDSNGGSGTTDDETFTYGTSKNLIANGFERTGYTFSGWNTRNDGKGTSYTDTAEITKISLDTAAADNTITLYAQWTVVPYTISYELDGGTNNASNPASYTITTAAISLGEPTRTGYAFAGWTGSNGTTAQQSVTIPSGSTGPKNYTAHWTANTYTVAYNGNGSTSGATASSTHTYDVAQALTANGFSRAYTVTYDHNYTGSTDTSADAAYAFAGWNTQADGSGTSYADNANVKNLATTGTFNLYAQWTPSAVTLETPSRTGYTFAGWYTDEACIQSAEAEGGSYTPTANTTLYAQWTANTYTVAYNGNGSTSGTTASSTHIYDVTKALTENGYSRDYTVTYNHNDTGSTDTSANAVYAFAGWNTQANGSGTSYADNANVKNLVTTGTFNLYAQWTPSAVTLETPSRTGYTFAGWYTDAGTKAGDAGTAYTPASSLALYAQWTPISYKVHFDANGGTGSMTDESIAYDAASSLTANAFARAGYHFAGWSAAETGTVLYTDQQAVSNLISDPNPDGTSGITLYAQWAEDADVMINYASSDMAMGTVSSDHESIAPATGTAAGSTAEAKPGYHFVSWTDQSGTAVSAESSFAPAKIEELNVSAAYTANFAPNIYTIKFDGNSGTGTMADQSLTYGVSAKLSSNSFTLNGFSFSSWNTVKDGSGTSYNDAEDVVKIALDTAGTDHAITLYAQWRINPEQSSFRVLQSEITEVPEALKAIQGLDSPARIKAAMRVTITDAEQEIPTANIEVYDVRLQFSTDEGKTWIDATKDNFPKEGITVVLPYPEGTNASSFNFVITHMFTIGEKAGSTENLSYVKTPEGLQVHVTSLSPFAIGYVRKASAEKKGLWCITYLDSRGNTVSVQWVETGKAPIKPAGYSYPDISNVSANQDVRPTSDRIDTGYVVPNTADQG